MDSIASADNELKALQIANAGLDSTIKNLDIKLKEFELGNKPGFWKSVVISPAIIAALIAILATVGTAMVSAKIASHQRDLERMKYQASLISGVMLSAKPGDRCSTRDQLAALLGAQVFIDSEFRQEADRLLYYFSRKCPN